MAKREDRLELQIPKALETRGSLWVSRVPHGKGRGPEEGAALQRGTLVRAERVATRRLLRYSPAGRPGAGSEL